MNLFKFIFVLILCLGDILLCGSIKLNQNNRKRYFLTTTTTTRKPPDSSKSSHPTRTPTIHFGKGKGRGHLIKTKSRNPTFEYKDPLDPNNQSLNVFPPLFPETSFGNFPSNRTVPKAEEIIPVNLTIGIVLPPSNFRGRSYKREIKFGVDDVNKKARKMHLSKYFHFEMKDVVTSYMKSSSSPTTILTTLCEEFLQKNVSSILYLFNMETFGRATASVQYFFQLASYLGIPVISWNADNSGLERDQRSANLQLQLAPSIEHQALAMLSILERYSWPKFAIVTTQIAGHNDFIQAVRDIISQRTIGETGQEFTLMDTLVINDPEKDIKQLHSSESRIMFLYSTRAEASGVLAAATKYGLTGRHYLWIVTQSVIQSISEAPKGLPVGMLGVHFGTSHQDMIAEIRAAINVFGAGIRNYFQHGLKNKLDLTPSMSCDSGNAKWEAGSKFYGFLRNVSIDLDLGIGKKTPNLEFNPDGTRKWVRLKIMNLRPDATKKNIWEEIGVWHSNNIKGLQVKDIVWPGHSHVPPNGIPEKFHLKITFLDEPPFLNMDPPHPETGRCTANKGVLCRIAKDEDMEGVNLTMAVRNSSYFQCCSGFCIDLLVKFSEDLGFSFDLFKVEDNRWGAIHNGKWTGLPGAVLNGKADMILTSFKINSQRKEVLDFSVPFLDTGITIVVTKRTGIISPTAFLEPFDTASWMLVAVVAIQVAAISIFIFEWLSPAGFNMRFHPPSGQRFSLLRTLWLVWAILFQAAVNIDVPRSVTARVMGNVWAMFALIFLAIYTANLAAFMITREEFYDLSGIEDKRIQNPASMKPPFRFGTTSFGHTDVIVKKAFPEMHSYMKQFNQSSPAAGVKAVKKGGLDAFLYDATVLEYLTGQDDECRLLTVGSWYALTGYGVAFRRNSKYLPLFNSKIMKYRENGYLERLTRFWFTGACQPENQYNSSSEPLALEQFMSTFFLLGCGVVVGLILLSVEHLYYKYLRFLFARWKYADFCSLISMSMGSSVRVAQDGKSRGGTGGRTSMRGSNKPLCVNPACDITIWKIKHDLDLAKLRVRYLEKQLVESGIWKMPKRGKRVLYRQSNDEEDKIVETLMEPLPIMKRASPHHFEEENPFDRPFDRNFDRRYSSERRRRRSERASSDRWSERSERSYDSRCSHRSSRSVPPDSMSRRDFTANYVTSTELIRKPLIDKRGCFIDMDEIETVL